MTVRVRVRGRGRVRVRVRLCRATSSGGDRWEGRVG